MSRADVYTYYYRDGRVEVREGSLQGRGIAWVDGAYPPPTYPSAMNVQVGEPGVRVITVIGGLQAHKGDVDGVLREWSGRLTRDDVDAAVAYYEQPENREQIDRQFAEDSALA